MAALRAAETIGRPLGTVRFLERIAGLAGRAARAAKLGQKKRDLVMEWTANQCQRDHLNCRSRHRLAELPQMRFSPVAEMKISKIVLIALSVTLTAPATAQNCTSTVVGNQVYTHCQQQPSVPAPDYGSASRPPPGPDLNTILQLGILRRQQQILEQQRLQQQRMASPEVPNNGLVFPRRVKDYGGAGPENRMKTCLEQYKENKPLGKNGDLNWIQSGGGYYSVCNAYLVGRTGAR